MPNNLTRTPPSGNTISALESELKDLWGPSFQRDSHYRDILKLKNRIEVIEPNEDLVIQPIELHTGRAPALLEHAQSFLSVLPRVIVEPQRLDTPSRRDAEQAEKFYLALVIIQLMENDNWEQLARNILAFGRGVLLSLPLPSAWTAQEGFPVRTKGMSAKQYIAAVNEWKRETGKAPLVIKAVPADQILVKLDANDKAMLGLQTIHLTAQQVAEDLGSTKVQELMNRGALQWHDTLRVLRYIDDVHVAFYEGNVDPVRIGVGAVQPSSKYKRLKAWEHGLGKCPIVFIPGMRTDELEYEFRFKPLIADAEEDLEAFDFVMSRMATIIAAFAFPSFEQHIDRPSTEYVGQERPTLDVNIGGTTTTFADETLKPIQIPKEFPDLAFFKEQLDALVQRNTLEDVLFGTEESSGQSGFSLRLRINVAKNKLVRHGKNMAKGLVEVLDLVARAVLWLDEEVVVGGEEITPAMAKASQKRTTVALDTKLPGEEGIALQKAKMAQDLGLPEPWYLEKLVGVDDPESLLLLRDVLEMEQLPEVRQRILEDALEELQVRIEDTETLAVLDAINKFGDQLDPEVIAALQGLMTGEPSGEAPPPPPGGEEGGAGLGRGPFPPDASNQAVGGGRNAGRPMAPRASQAETGAASIDVDEDQVV